MSVRHGPRSRTVLSIGSLAVTTRERKGRVPARRVRRVWCPCLADVHCLFGVQGGWPKGTETGHPSGQNPGSQGLFSQARLSLLLKRKVNRTAGGSLQSGTACLGTETGPGWFSVLFLWQRTCFREGSHHSRGGRSEQPSHRPGGGCSAQAGGELEGQPPAGQGNACAPHQEPL